MMFFESFLVLDNLIYAKEEYSLRGLAYYMQAPEDVIFEIAIGKNTDPSSSLLRKIIEIHRAVRPDLYQDVFHKLMRSNLS